MSENELLEKFKKQLISFFDGLIEQHPEEGDLVVARFFLSDVMPIKTVMDIFNYNINKEDGELLVMIENRNEAFFLEHNMFDGLGKENINHFKHLWRAGGLDQDDKDGIWEWVDVFVAFAQKYADILEQNAKVQASQASG